MHELTQAALVAPVEAKAPWDIQEVQTYRSQKEAHEASVKANLADALRVMDELDADPTLADNAQVVEEMENRLRFLEQQDYEEEDFTWDEGITGPYRAVHAQAEAAPIRARFEALRASRPAPEPDKEMAARLAWIRKHVAPLRDADSLLPLNLGTGPGASLTEKLGQVFDADQGEAVEPTPAAGLSFEGLIDEA